MSKIDHTKTKHTLVDDGIKSVSTPLTVIEDIEFIEMSRLQDQTALIGSDHSLTCTDISDNESLNDNLRPAFAVWAD